MQLLRSNETAPKEARDFPKKPEEHNTLNDSSSDPAGTNKGVALDVSGKSLRFSAPVSTEDDNVESLYMYNNVYNLIPKSVGGLVQLTTLNFFKNEINLFVSKFGNMTRLECLQMKVFLPDIGRFPLHKLKGLKQLELSKGPPKPPFSRIEVPTMTVAKLSA